MISALFRDRFIRTEIGDSVASRAVWYCAQKRHLRIRVKILLINLTLFFSLKLTDFKIRETHPEWLVLSKGTKEL